MTLLSSAPLSVKIGDALEADQMDEAIPAALRPYLGGLEILR